MHTKFWLETGKEETTSYKLRLEVLSGGVHHWLKRRSIREEIKPVTRDNSIL
jgi:hypothetical protein